MYSFPHFAEFIGSSALSSPHHRAKQEGSDPRGQGTMWVVGRGRTTIIPRARLNHLLSPPSDFLRHLFGPLWTTLWVSSSSSEAVSSAFSCALSQSLDLRGFSGFDSKLLFLPLANLPAQGELIHSHALNLHLLHWLQCLAQPSRAELQPSVSWRTSALEWPSDILEMHPGFPMGINSCHSPCPSHIPHPDKLYHHHTTVQFLKVEIQQSSLVPHLLNPLTVLMAKYIPNQSTSPVSIGANKP